MWTASAVTTVDGRKRICGVPAGAGPLAATMLLAAVLVGCVPPQATLSRQPGQARPTQGTALISMSAAARQLEMRLVRSSRYSASFANQMNRLILLAPPRPGVLLNGREIAGAEQIVESESGMAVPIDLVTRIRRQLRQPPRPTPRRRTTWTTAGGISTSAPAKRVGSPWITVVVDAGHGGKDPGALNKFNRRLNEKDINLDTALQLELALRAKGVRVIMTRSDDTYLTLERRSEIANRSDAAAFVSLHADAATRASAAGFTIYIARKASSVSAALGKAVAESLGSRTGPSRGVRGADYRVLVNTRCPAILIEQGFLTNRAEAGKLAKGSYRRTLADAIANGIVRALK